MAHHSFAMFDTGKKVTISGTVKQLEWSNPHAWMHVMVMGQDGTPQEWTFEMGSLGQIAAEGWKSDTVKPGDKIAVEAHPMKDGTRGGQYVAAVLPDGRRLFNGQNRQDDVNTNIPHD